MEWPLPEVPVALLPRLGLAPTAEASGGSWRSGVMASVVDPSPRDKPEGHMAATTPEAKAGQGQALPGTLK